MQETAVSYFAKFRSALKEAYSKGLLEEDLYSLVKPIKANETHKERLELAELQKLISTPMGPEVMKRLMLPSKGQNQAGFFHFNSLKIYLLNGILLVPSSSPGGRTK